MILKPSNSIENLSNIMDTCIDDMDNLTDIFKKITGKLNTKDQRLSVKVMQVIGEAVRNLLDAHTELTHAAIKLEKLL